MEQNMFCYQCQETAGCTGCTKMGVCGKTPHVAALQDLLVWVTKGLSAVTTQMRREDLNVTGEINQLITKNLFTTITNANFDPEMITSQIEKTLQIKKVLLLQLKNPEKLPEAARWSAAPSEFAAKAATVGVLSAKDEDIRSLRELITYGLKGLSAYSRHANVLLKEDKELDTFLQRALAATLDDTLTVEDLVNLTLETGKYGVSGMALLDQANTEAYGNPEITKVNIGVGKNPGILISGHDLKDLEMLLEQTEGTGIDVYTHSEMLPAHYYPAFKKYSHFRGNYGNAWWKQKEEFESFHGAIRKFVVMAGCDGRAKSRSYYTDFAKALPKDTVILTAGCAKYKYNKLNLGDINGIPRVLDAGQCNDSYSLAVIALKLKEIFELNDINELPIIYNIAWYEQKAVIVLLALLSLGVKNIHLGPTLPAFLSPNVTKLLIENFQISGIDTVEHDMRLFFGE